MNPVVEVLRAMGQGIAGSVPAGLGGAAELIRTGDIEKARQAQDAIQGAFTYEPQTLEAEAALYGLSKGGEFLEQPFKWAGGKAMDLTGSPEIATAVETIPQVLSPSALASRALRAYEAKPDVVEPIATGPGKGQTGAMVVGGPQQDALLGRKLPEVPDTLDEQMAAANYQMGSAPGVYTHGDIPSQRARGTLSEAEREMVAELPQDAQKKAADMVREYRSTHHPGLGWGEATPASITINAKGQPEINWQMQAPQFHINPETGKPYEGIARGMQVEEISNRMVAEVEDLVQKAGAGDANAQFIVDQARWYKDAEREIKNLFGTEGELYANIQGSLSPNTRLSQQHKMAQEVFERFTRGDFDEAIGKFDTHMAKKPDDVSVSKWARELNNPKSEHYDPSAVLKKESGALYGMNSTNAMMALRGLMNKLEPGMAPKMRTFAGNLGGRTPDTTVDVWAGRTAQRLSGLPRVPPATDAGVPGVVARPKAELYSKGEQRAMEKAAKGEKMTAADKRNLEKAQDRVASPDITAQYGFANDAFKTAAAKLGMDPDDLQAMLWFREKELWESQGWTPVDAQPSLVELIKQDNPPSSALVQSLRQ